MKRKMNIRKPRFGPKTTNAAMGAGIGYSYTRGWTSRFGPSNFRSSNSIQNYNAFANGLDDIGDQVDNGQDN